MLVLFTSASAVRHYNLSMHLWNNEFRSGKWAHLDRVPVERARQSVITGVFINMNFPNGSVLDVGCGEGTLSDYLNPVQRPKYLGLDIAREAVRIARQKRPDLAFKAHECENFVPRSNFDVIVFNEMLYYTEHVDIMKRFSKFLNPGGIFVISIWFSDKIDYLRKSIFDDAEKLFPKSSLGAIQLKGNTLNLGKTREVSFQIEAFRVSPPLA